MKIQVFFYQTENGEQPALNFLNALDVKMRTKMLHTIEFLQEYGPELREPHSKPLGDGLFELRAQVGSDISRVVYFFFVGRRAILTNGFIKKTQKTPKSEIALAKKYRDDYLHREV